MRLLVDLQGCQNGSRHRGIGRYTLALVKALCRNAGQDEVLLLVNGLFPDTIAGIERAFAGLIPRHHILHLHAPGPVNELEPGNARRQHAAEWLREAMIADIAPDAVLVSSMVEGATDNSITSVGWIDSGAVVGAILYDLIPLSDPERHIAREPARRWYHGKLDSLRRCDLLLCISDSAAREAHEALGMPAARAVAISTAADEKFVGAVVTQAQLDACRACFGIRRRYVMHSGNVEPRKNFDGLIRAYGAMPMALRRNYQLVLTGKVSGESQQQLEAEAAKAGLAASDMVLTGHVTDDDLMALYAGCHLFVFPSLHEGFGLPALEAMHFGVPTIGSSTTSVPEVIGRADACFDPTSTAAISALMRRCLTDSSFYAELKAHAQRQARRFDWDAIARHTWRLYEQALAGRALAADVKDGPARSNNWMDLMMGQLVAPPQLPPPNDTELAELAQSLADNEAEALRFRSHAAPGRGLRWRIEGPFDGSYSLALVNREAARALAALGHEVALHSTEGPGDFAPNPAFLDAHPDLQQMLARAPALPAAAADVQARNLYPPRVADMTGRLRLLQHYAWEETGFPAAWADAFNQHLDGITCTSVHVQKVLQDNGVQVPTAVVGNGVDHWDRIVATPGLRFPGKRVRFLHVSSCFARKGADVMLSAFGDAFTQADDVSLVIKTFPNPHNDIAQQIASLRRANPRFPDVHLVEDDLGDADLKALVAHCHVLVAPSRAEGFGLPLAEALLSGLPLITTAWSGQLDFCTARNSWLVDFRYGAAQSHFGLHGSVWAEPDRASLARAMRAAHATSADERRAMAAHGRRVLMRHFTWQQVAARGVAAVRGWAARPVRTAPRIGWVTTWNTRCGIASYARHIIEAAGQPVTVLAPLQSALVRADEDFVFRSWLSSKEENDFGQLALRIHDQTLDVLVVQFNYGFYQLRDFAAFLNGQIDAGRAVIVTMHATGDPPALAVWDDNWRLETARDALARCHRLLVHTVADLNRLKEAGLTANVSLFPHPLWQLPAVPHAAPGAPALPLTPPLLATFGYCLPHKGLPETLRAVAALRRRGQTVRLLMLNAEYPDAVSGELVHQLRQEIDALELADLVDFRSDYLTDAEAAALLSQAELIVFAYHETQESASGAVRHGMAAGRPVLVTPIPIFDDLGGGVFRAAGTDDAAVADGMAQALAAIAKRSPQVLAVEAAAKAWCAAHDVALLGRRLFGLCHALATPPRLIDFHFAAGNRALRSEVGRVEDRGLASTGKAGHLMYGPHLALPPGRYVAELTWTCTLVAEGAQCHLRVVMRGGSTLLRHKAVESDLQAGAMVTRLPFDLEHACGDLEVQLQVDAGVQACVQTLRVRSRVALATPDTATTTTSTANTTTEVTGTDRALNCPA